MHKSRYKEKNLRVTHNQIRKISALVAWPVYRPAAGYTPLQCLRRAETGLTEKLCTAANSQQASAAPGTQAPMGGTGPAGHPLETSPAACPRSSPACGGQRRARGGHGVHGAGPGPSRGRRRSARSSRRTAPAAAHPRPRSRGPRLAPRPAGSCERGGWRGSRGQAAQSA